MRTISALDSHHKHHSLLSITAQADDLAIGHCAPPEEDTFMTSFSAIASLLAASAFNSSHSASSIRQAQQVQTTQQRTTQRTGQ